MLRSSLSDHAQIKKKKKHFDSPIYHPHDWAQLIRMTGNKTPFKVIEIEREDFKDFGNVYKSITLMMKKQNQSGDRIVWRSIKWFRFEKKDPLTLYYKNTLAVYGIFHVINMAKPVSHQATQNTTSTIENLIIPLCNENPPTISVEKKEVLLSLLKYIPSVYHTYYKDLTENQVEDPIINSEEEED